MIYRYLSFLQSNKSAGFTNYIQKHLPTHILVLFTLFVYHTTFALNDSTSVSFLKRALLQKEKSGKVILYNDYLTISEKYLIQGKPDSSLLYDDSAHLVLKKDNDTLLVTYLEMNKGKIYLSMGSFNKALVYFYKALVNAENEHDTVNLIRAYTNVGTAYKRLEKYNEALENYKKCYELSKASNNLEGIAYSYSIGLIYRKKGDNSTALEYYYNALPACKELNMVNDIINIYNNISNIYMLEHKYDEAAAIFRKNILLSDSLGFKRQIGIAYANLGKTRELTKHYDSAVYYLKKAMVIFNANKYYNLKSIGLKMLSNVYTKMNDYEKALTIYKKHIKLSDSLSNEKTRKQVEELKIKYDTEKKEKENNILFNKIESEKHKSKYLIIVSIILFIVGVLSLVLFYFIRKHAITDKKLAESEAANLEMKLESQKKDLALSALMMSKNLEFSNRLIEELEDLSGYVTEEGYTAFSRVIKQLKSQGNDAAWNEFEKRFLNIHTDFYRKLLEEFPNLTHNELKICAFLRLGMNTKDICSITFQNIRTVETTRFRLRKKLNLSTGENLSTFLQGY